VQRTGRRRAVPSPRFERGRSWRRGSGSGGLPALEPLVPVADASVPEGQGGSFGLVDAGGVVAAGGMPASDAGVSDAGDAAARVDAAPDCSTNLERCDGIDNNCDGAIDEGSACVSTCAGFALDGHGYMFCSDSVVREDAAARCQAEGMHLAWIETSQENTLLVSRIRAANVPASQEPEILTYIGGSDSVTEGAWIWRGGGTIPDSFQYWQGQSADDGGEAVAGAFANWSPTEPNDTDDDEDCAVMSVLGNNNREPGNWDDRSCGSELPFVCEAL
jgi:hypothetical protein